MPKGFTTLPDGRVVGSKSNELKQFMLENPEYKPVGKPKPPSILADGEGFEPPPPPMGEPKKIEQREPSKTASKEKARVEEIEDYKQLVSAVFSGVAALAGSQVYRFDDAESEAVAKPLSRILARNSGLKKAVSQVADPVALFSAVAFPLGIKYAIHREELKIARARNVTSGFVQDVSKGAQPNQPIAPDVINVPQAPPSSFDDTLSRIANTA